MRSIPQQSESGQQAPDAPPKISAAERPADDATHAPGGGRGVAGAPAGGEAAAAAPGLVSSITSQTPPHLTRQIQGLEAVVDPRQQRMARARRSIKNAARLITKRLQRGGSRYRVAFVTLTYKDADAWRPGHIAKFIDALRKWLARRGVPLLGLWKLEMQKRGAVHYHLLIWLPRGVTLPKPDKRGWWPHGLTNCTWARNAYGYVAKYLEKDEAALIPKGARLFALIGLTKPDLVEIRWWNSPKWLREQWSLDHAPVRAPGGGWLSRLTGEIARSTMQFAGFHWHEGRRLIRFVRAEWRPAERTDYRQAVERDQETRFWLSAAQTLQWAADPIRWMIREGVQ